MKSYEGVFVLPPDAAGDAHKVQIKNLEDIIQRHNGTIQQKQELGKRSLGYSIRKFREANIVVFDFQMDPAKATEFRKALELQEELLNYMITLKDETAIRRQAEKAKLAATAKPLTPATPQPAATR